MFKKYNIPWILKWNYAKNGDILFQHYFANWWEKFAHLDDTISFIYRDYPLPAPNIKNLEEFLIPKQLNISPGYPLIAIQATTSPDILSSKKKTISKNSDSLSSKSKRKNILDGLRKKYLSSLLKRMTMTVIILIKNQRPLQ